MSLPAARIADQTMHGGTITVGFPTVLIGNMPAARIGDMHVCPMVTGVVPHVGGPLVLGAFTVLVGNMPQSRSTDMAICVGPPDAVAKGEPTVLIGMAGAAGLGGLLKGLAMAAVQLLKGSYPRAMLQPDGTYITQYSEAIVIKGDSEFQARVVADLDRIRKTPTGERLLASIGNGGKQVTIQETSGGNSCGYPASSAADRFAQADGSAGKGSDAIVSYNPDREKIGNEPWETRPPAIGLAHELVHAEQATHGTMKQGMADNDNKPDPTDPSKMEQEKIRELEAAGVPPHDGGSYTENKIRGEWDPPQPERKWY